MIHEIERWDASYESVSAPPFEIRPIITVTLDSSFHRYAASNDWFVPVHISHTGGRYDGIWWAAVDEPADECGCACERAYPVSQKRRWILTLRTVWRGYPLQLGGVSIPSSSGETGAGSSGCCCSGGNNPTAWFTPSVVRKRN